MRRVMLSLATPDTLTARSTWLAQSRQKSTVFVREVQFVLDVRISRRMVVAGSHTLEGSNLRLKGDDLKTNQIGKGADSNLPGRQPKEKAAQLPH